MSLTNRVKVRLKQIRAVYDLNASAKATFLWLEKHEIDRRYRRQMGLTVPDISCSAIRRMIEARTSARNIRIQEKMWGDLRVFCVGTYYEQENAGFLQALRRMGRVVVFENDRGGYGLRASLSARRDSAIAEANGRCLIEQVQRARREGSIDVLIGTMVAQTVPLHALQAVRDLGVPVVNIAMDDRLPEHWRTRDGVRHGAIGLAPATDLVLQTTAEYVPRYVYEGCPAILWPFGSDPSLFRPSLEKDFDVVFVGNNYGWRHELIAAITDAGIRVDAFGLGFPNGHVRAERVATVFTKARIVLGYGYVSYSRRITTLKLRDFDGPMSGSLYLTTYNRDLEKLFDLGREIDTYSSIGECVEKIAFYLANAQKREEMAAAGRARALRDHTWDARLREAFETLGVLRASPRSMEDG